MILKGSSSLITIFLKWLRIGKVTVAAFDDVGR